MDRILFFRVMKVTDNGGNVPNLVSQDGRKLYVVHLQDDKMLYRQYFQSFWAFGYQTHRNKIFFLNNKQHTVKAIPGTEN
jgi:hypothetical protein